MDIMDGNDFVNNEKKLIITMHQMSNKKRLLASLFGNPKLRKEIYRIWFKQKRADEENNCEND